MRQYMTISNFIQKFKRTSALNSPVENSERSFDFDLSQVFSPSQKNLVEKQIRSIFDETINDDDETNLNIMREDMAHVFVSHQHECPICMTIMAEPCKFPCGHMICAQCAWDILCHKHQCPFDRIPIANDLKITVDRRMQKIIKQTNPVSFETHLQQLKHEEKLLADQYFFQLEIGHTFEVVKNPSFTQVGKNGFKSMKYKWTLFLKGVGPQNEALADRLIKHIDVQLNPLCVSGNHRNMKKLKKKKGCAGHYELSSKSWCQFKILLTIQWDPSRLSSVLDPFKNNHEMSFKDPSQEVTIENQEQNNQIKPDGGELKISQVVVFKFKKRQLKQILEIE